MATVTIYTTSSCGYCARAKALFSKLGVGYEEVSLDGRPGLRNELSAKYSWRTVPMIVVNGEFVGGYDDVARMQAQGTLLPLLEGGVSAFT